MNDLPLSPGPAASYTQESLWLVDKISRRAGTPTYHEPITFQITGEIDTEALREALRRVVARHDALRTSFTDTSAGLRTAVREAVPDVLTVLDLRHGAPDEAAARAEDVLAEDYRRPFDLGADPLLRAVLVRLPDAENLLGLTLHHLATDGWSNTIVLDELGGHYRSLHDSGLPAGLPELAARHADHVLRERREHEGGGHAEAIAHWKKSLVGGPELLRLPLDHPRPPIQTFAGSSRTVRMPRRAVSPLLERCRKEYRGTDFTVLLAAYALLLHRYTGQDEVTVGTTVLNRNGDDLLDVVGCFVNTAALVLNVDDDMTFRQLLAHAGEVSGEVLNHGQAPYPKVLESLDIQRDPSYNPVFQTMLTLLGRRPGLDLGEGTAARPHPIRRAAAKFEILLYVAETDDEFEFEAEFNTDLFAPDTVERMLRHYVRLLESLADDLDAPVSQVSFLPEDERATILDVWNDTAVDYPYATVVDMFEAQVRRTPDAVAVEFRGTALTYRELDLLTNQVARFVAERRGDAATPFVGVYMERSLEMVIALVSIVKAGCAYVPIDPEYPADRIEFMISDANPSLILTQERHRARLQGGSANIAVLSTADPRTEDDSPVARDVTEDSAAYMIYTSGLTGRPKGVVNRHISLFNRLYWMQSEYGLTGEDRVLQKTPFSFDVSVWEFFWPLMFGARIVVARPGGHKDTDYMKRLIHDRGITTVHFIPSILNVFLEEDDLSAYCGSLRRVICSGEALPFAAVEKFTRILSCGLHNLYGPTEAAIDVSYWPCTTDYPGSIVPIGRPIANVRLYVLDKHRGLAPIGVPGELCIGGVALAIGYHNRAELTGTVFVEDPYGTEPAARLYRTGDLARFLPDGQIQYLGRIDNQIKLRGVRIEPEEVSAALLALPNVRDAAVVLREFGASRALVGYVVADEFDQQEVRAALAQRLPDFMVPQVVMAIPALPTTANGKLDRKALPNPHESAAEEEVPEPPSTERERDLVRIWAEVLGTDRIGVDANFFRHGGDSILSIRVAAKLREHGYAVQVHDIFANSTIRQLAVVLEHSVEAEPAVAQLALLGQVDRDALPAGVTDAWPLTMLQAGMIYHTMLHEDSSVYHDVFDYEVAGEAQPDLLRQAVADVIVRHPQLRSTFDLDSFDRPLQLVHADATAPVEVVDLAGRPRAEQDEAVARWVAGERGRPFDLAAGPLVRFTAYVRSTTELNLAISFHHIVLDGWSVALVVEEIRSRYADRLAGRAGGQVAEPASYGTYVELEHRAVADPAQRAYWSDLLAGVPATTLSTVEDAGRAAEPATAERIVPAEVADGMRRFATRLGAPAKSAYLAVHLTVLGRLTGRRTVVTGLVSNGRPEVAGGAELVGLFLNTLPFPMELRTESWGSLVGRVLTAEQDSSPHRRFPLAEIQRLTGGTALFDTVFNYTDFHVYANDPGLAVRITGARYFEQTNFAAVVHVHRDHFAGQLRVFVNYDAAHIDGVLIERYLDDYLAAVTELAGEVRADGDDLAATVSARAERAGRPPTRAPRPDAERRVAEIVALVLDRNDLGVDDDYMELGLDSISAIRLVAKLRRIDPAMSMTDVFACRTVAALAARLGAGGTATEDAGELRPFELADAGPGAFEPEIVDAYPATATQLDMIRATDRDLVQAAYHDVFAYRVPLPMHPEPLRAALRRVMNAHDTFRTAFLLNRDVPLQAVHESVEPRLDVVQDGDPDDWFEAERGTSFDWATPGLIRFAAHRSGPDGFVLTLGFHHSIIDGWSLSLFVRDVVADYRAAIRGEAVAPPAAPALRYREYVRAELKAVESPETREFWLRTLDGAPEATLSHLAPAEPGPRWSEAKLVLDEARHDALSAVAARFEVPVKHVLLAAHLRVLAVLTGEWDVVTGVFTNGRPETDEGEAVLGMFLNFLPLRLRIADQTWREFVREVFDDDRRALPHRRYPQARIRSDVGRDLLFPALFNYTRFTAYRGVVTDARWFEHVDVPLLVNVGHDLRHERMVITLNADGRVLSPGSLDVIAGLYDEVLASLLATEGALVSEMSAGMADIVDKLRLP